MADEVNILESFNVGTDRLYVDDHEPLRAIRLDLRMRARTGQPGGKRRELSLYLPSEEAEALGRRLLDLVSEARMRKDH